MSNKINDTVCKIVLNNFISSFGQVYFILKSLNKRFSRRKNERGGRKKPSEFFMWYYHLINHTLGGML